MGGGGDRRGVKDVRGETREEFQLDRQPLVKPWLVVTGRVEKMSSIERMQFHNLLVSTVLEISAGATNK